MTQLHHTNKYTMQKPTRVVWRETRDTTPLYQHTT